MRTRKPYSSEVSDAERTFVARYLTLMKTDAPQYPHDPREIFNGLRGLVQTGAPWWSCRMTCRRRKLSISRPYGGSQRRLRLEVFKLAEAKRVFVLLLQP